MKNKVATYMGFAAKARKIVTGYNTCIYMMGKKKVKLLVIAEDLSENSMKKAISAADKQHVPYRIYGSRDNLSHITGNVDKGIFGIVDDHFAKIISDEIDHIQSV